MKKYIYSPHHQGLVEAPLMDEPRGPVVCDCWVCKDREAAKEAHNNWKASLITVPEQYLDCFEDGKEYDESEFKIQNQIMVNVNGVDEWVNLREDYVKYTVPRLLRKVAIPLQSRTGAIEDKKDDLASDNATSNVPCDAPFDSSNSIWHNAKYRRLASMLFSMAADEFGNHGCNDVDETLFTDWTEPEKLQLAVDFENWNCGHLDDLDPNHIAFNDSALMSFFADMLNSDKNDKPSVATESASSNSADNQINQTNK
jgi:hypothetical protein